MSCEIVVMDYAASRLEFFEELKKKYERKLHWWMNQKPYKQYSLITIQSECSYNGAVVCYLEDIIKMLRSSEQSDTTGEKG